MKALLSILILISAPWWRDDPFFVELSPPPEEASPLYLCSVGESTISSLEFFISDDAVDGIPTAWEWTIEPVDELPDAVPPRLSTDGALDNVSGVLNDGDLIRDLLLVNGFGATETEYTLKLFVYSQGGDIARIFEYRLFVGGSTAAFTLDASPHKNNGAGVLCQPQGSPVTLTANLTEDPAFPPYTYLWSEQDLASQSIEVGKPGNYSVTVTNGCSATREASIAVETGAFPSNVSHDFPLPEDPLFRACPDGDFYLEGSANNATDFQWQVRPPAATDFQDIEGFPGSAVTIAVDGENYGNGSEYRLVAENDGCLKSSEDPPISLQVLEAPQLSTTDLTEATVPIGESTMYELVVNNTYGQNSCLLWELIYFDQDGLEQRDTLKKDDGTYLTAADAAPAGMEVPVSGTTVVSSDMVVGWEVTVTELFPGIENVQLLLTNLDNGSADALFRLKFSVVNKDDNTFATTGTDQLECSAALTEEGMLVFLPVELLYFNGEHTDAGVLLRWATATESNNDFFTLERSYDGRDFEAIATVPGAGTTSETRNYSFYDKTLPLSIPANIVYYRLKQTDFDGQFSYSDIILINLHAKTDQLTLDAVFTTGGFLFFHYQNPQAGELTATIYDYSGRLILRQVVTSLPGSRTSNLSLPELPASIYVLQLNDGKQEVSRRWTKPNN